MFAQVIQGKTSDAEGLLAAMDRWTRELQPGSVGWLSSTMGVADDGTFIAVARFESAEAAGRNAQRPEQGQWWEKTSRLFDGEVTFRDTEDVTVDMAGAPDAAGFVQIRRGGGSAAAGAKEIMGRAPIDVLPQYRREIRGSAVLPHDDGGWPQVVYSPAEAEAREGERKEPPVELQN